MRPRCFFKFLQGSRPPANLGPPPAHAHKQETPVVEKFRRLAFKSVADKLEDPSDQKQAERIDPQAVKEAAQNKQWDGKQDGRDTERVARAVHRMLVTGAVLRDPFMV